jgi:putative membrane protein
MIETIDMLHRFSYIKLSIILLILFFLATAAFFTSTIHFNNSFILISTFFTIFLSLPTFYFFAKWAGKKNLIILFVLGLLAIVIESFALETGFPYGHFVYNIQAGYKIFNSVPVTTPFAWIMILCGCFAISAAFSRDSFWKICLSTIGLMVWSDLLLDPVAVSLGWWYWPNGGIYYGVPLVNFLGWVISATIGVLMFGYLIKRTGSRTFVPPALALSFYCLFIFLLGVSFWKNLYLPFSVGILFMVVNHRSWRVVLKQFLYE